MAKIFKASGYIVDVNGDSNVDEVIAEVSSEFDGMINQHIHVEEADIGEWDDESPLNYDNCDLADCEKYFKRKVPVETDRKVEIGKTYRHFKGAYSESLAYCTGHRSTGTILCSIRMRRWSYLEQALRNVRERG